VIDSLRSSIVDIHFELACEVSPSFSRVGRKSEEKIGARIDKGGKALRAQFRRESYREDLSQHE